VMRKNEFIKEVREKGHFFQHLKIGTKWEPLEEKARWMEWRDHNDMKTNDGMSNYQMLTRNYDEKKIRTSLLA
jgi:hypothetical protein